MPRTSHKKHSGDRSEDRLGNVGNRSAVGELWASMTVLQSRLLLLQIVGLLAVVGTIFTWYDKFFPFFERHPILSIVIIAAPPLYILCFSVAPQMWQLYRKAQRDSTAGTI
jgi:hypothetical protein